MNATTVPPPGWNPIGAPEIRAHTRRFFSRAFVISGAGHLAVLALVLWVQSRDAEPELRLTEGVIRFSPPPPLNPDFPPARPGASRTKEVPPGTPEPIPEVRVAVPKAAGPVGGDKKTKDEHPATTPPAPSEAQTAWREPTEVEFVAYDRPPVPYYRPSPEYPQWARDAGIEGRVLLHVLVGRDGRVARIKVLRDVEGLTGAAREAITRWLFHPAVSGKNAVAVWVEIPIEFKL